MNKSQELSRRDFCKHSTAFAVSAVAFITLGPRLAAAQTKMTQQQVSYQDTPKGTQVCVNCKLFVSPDACKSVEGKISPQGWCTLFEPTT